MSLFKKMKSPLSKDDLQEPKNLDSLNLLTMSEDYKFELKWWNRMLFGKLILRNITYCIVQIEAILVLANREIRLGDMLAKTQVIKS